jgi:hypothetical protein
VATIPARSLSRLCSQLLHRGRLKDVVEHNYFVKASESESRRAARGHGGRRPFRDAGGPAELIPLNPLEDVGLPEVTGDMVGPGNACNLRYHVSLGVVSDSMQSSPHIPLGCAHLPSPG